MTPLPLSYGAKRLFECGRLEGVDDKQILQRITGLVDEEHHLRTRRLEGKLSSEEEASRLRDLEEALDQCWDLLRRRRAAREMGTNPDDVNSPGKSQEENYLQ
jgi:hypothetical protein